MKNVKKSLLAAVSASAVMFSLALPAMATWQQPDYSDVNSSITNMPSTIQSFSAGLVPINVNQIKVLYIEDILNASQITIVKNSLNNLSVNVLSLQNVLKTVKVLNGSSVLTFNDVLSHNNVPITDVITVKRFNDGGILVFGSRTGCGCTNN